MSEQKKIADLREEYHRGSHDLKMATAEKMLEYAHLDADLRSAQVAIDLKDQIAALAELTIAVDRAQDEINEEMRELGHAMKVQHEAATRYYDRWTDPLSETKRTSQKLSERGSR